jgi:iron complex transport system substrate-binding protein
MKAHFFLALALVIITSSLRAIEITDDQGFTTSLQKSPQRVISLLPSITETICVLKQCQKLVGIDRYSNWPESIQSLPSVGGGLDPNIEGITALKPDVVLVGKNSRASERLRSLGIKVIAFDVKDYADVHRALQRLALILNAPPQDAEIIWLNLQTQVNTIAGTLPKAAKGRRVYFEVSSTPFGAGESSFIGETLKRLQLINIIPSSLGPFPKLNPEFIVRENPDLIMMGYKQGGQIEGRPGWKKVSAVNQQRICTFTSSEADILSRPGPRLAEGAQIMANCISAKYP